MNENKVIELSKRRKSNTTLVTDSPIEATVLKDTGAKMICLTKAKNIIQNTIKQKKLSSEEVKRSFEVKKYNKLKQDNKEVTMLDMVLDKNLREEIYRRIDENYVETEEEKEIFELITERRKRDAEEIERELGFDKTEPIMLIESDIKDRVDKDEDFREWYEEELRNFYKQSKGTDEDTERYCTVAESIERSLKEVKLMQEGKLPKQNWRGAFKEIKLDGKPKITTQIAATPTLHGEDAKKVSKEVRTVQSKKAKENAKKLRDYFSKFVVKDE